MFNKLILLSMPVLFFIASCKEKPVTTTPSQAGNSITSQTSHNKDNQQPASATKPNFVFIFADDQSPKTIGAYGNNEIKTPNLDALAAKGVNFSNAYNMGAWNGAVCLASRTMLNTGRSVWQARAFQDQFYQDKGFDNTWAKLMEQAGYDTYITGKWHVHAPAHKLFNYTNNVRPGMPKDTWDHNVQVKRFADLAAGTSEYASYQDIMPIGYNRPLGPNDNSWSPTDPSHGGFYQGGQHWSEVLKDNAISFIEQASKKETPFFMYLAFNAPHDPRQAPEAYQKLYQAESLSLPVNFKANYPEKSLIGNGPSLRDAALAPFPRTAYATKVHLKEYYAIISHLDTQVGEIISALKKSGKIDNTYIVYTADHGLAVGEHGLFGKQNMYEHSVKAPFIIWGPDMHGGNTVDSDIYIQDVMATAIDLAGINKPDYVFFNSIKPLATGKQSHSHYPEIYGAYIDNQRMIKKHGFKLIVYPNANTVKLFNLKDDPNEMNNLAQSIHHKDTITSLFASLIKLQTSLNDTLDLTDMFERMNNQ